MNLLLLLYLRTTPRKLLRVVETKLHAFKTSSLRWNYVAGYTSRPLNPWEMNPLISYGQCGVPSRGKDIYVIRVHKLQDELSSHLTSIMISVTLE